ncbi:MAG: matrixin family metalloprotease [Actinobacteria bacterium]|nr:matrixin family metalloprotease [Actinomycetota bacterium]
MESPDDLPRSPSGRVPKWVVDERLRGRVEETQFRPPTRLAPVRTRRRSATLPAVVALLVVAVVVWVAVQGLALGGGGGTTAPLAGASPGPRQSTPTAGRDYPTPGYEEEATRLLPPATAPKASKAWRPLDVQVDAAGTPTTTPIMWDPCRPIRYVVRPDGAPPGGAELVAEGFRAMEKATGLKFVPDGTIDEAPSRRRSSFQPERYGDRWAPVLVAWQDADENPDFAADVAGQAGPASVSFEGRPEVYVSGSVVLDAKKFTTLLADPKARPFARLILMHELGHLVGLDHVNDKAQIMFPSATGEITALGDGDRTGLAALGRGPCAPWL